MPTLEEIRQSVTDENVQDIVSTAAEGGITYWALQPTAEEFAGLPEGKEHTIVEGVDERLFGGDREVESVHYLSKDDIREAYRKLVDIDQKYVNREYHGYILQSWIDRNDRDGIDAGHIDAGTADILVQVAIFDEVVYG